MPVCQVTRRERRGRVELQLSGTFDGASAWELARVLQGERGPVHIDFSQVASFNDYGLAVLANAVVQREDRSLHLVGLRQHQVRMLSYLGIDVDELGLAPEAAEDGDELPRAILARA